MSAFPLAYAVLMPALYAPIIAMLLGLAFRGVAFEFVAMLAAIGMVSIATLFLNVHTLFALSYAGLGISIYPYIVPQSLTIWQAALPVEKSVVHGCMA